MEQVAVIRRLCGEELEVLRGRTDDTDVTVLLAFLDRETATEYLSLSDELHGEGWGVAEVDLLALGAICCVYGVGYIALPTEPGLAGAVIGEALDMLDVLAAR